MAGNIERDVLEALQSATLTAVQSTAVPAFPIKFLGRVFPIPDNQKYLECVHIINNINGETWGEEKTYRGIWRLILHWSINDDGAYTPLEYLTTIIDFFTKDKMFAYGQAIVKVTEKPELTALIEASPELIFPVSIRYQCFKP